MRDSMHSGDDNPIIRPGEDVDAAARKARRNERRRLNSKANKTLLIGVAATLLGGIFWGCSGTSASYLFENYQVDTLWLMSVRQLFSGLLFMVIVLLFEREKLRQLLTTPRHLVTLAVFAFLGLAANQLFYLLAVRYTNAGTATVLQCLQLVLIMGFTCIAARRVPRPREIAGLILAFAGTFLIATAGDPSALSIPPAGLLFGLLSALSAACISIIPVKILPIYGSSVVTGTAMFSSGLVMSVVVQPWSHVPHLDGAGWSALAILVFIGSFLAYFLYLQGVKDIGSVRASLIGTVEPLSATVTSALVLGTVFAPTDLIGFACIIVMVFLTV